MKTVLRLVGPWFTWWDWRKIEMLNKVLREWCHTEDATIGLFELWQERNMSLYEMATQINFMGFLARDTNFENPIPFVGYSGGFGNRAHLVALYQSLLELSNLEKKIAGNAFCTGSCVRSDPFPIRGDEDDQWLLIDCDSIEVTKEKCIPLYYHLKFAVPKGLKIVLIDQDTYRFNDPSACREEIYMAVGRAAALGLSGLIVYNHDPFVTAKVWESFVSALQEQKYGEFVSPLEILSFPYPERYWCAEKESNVFERLRRVLPILGDQLVLGKLRNLKYLNLGYVDTKKKAEDFFLREVAYACPNLQVLELGPYRDYEYLQNIKLPDNVYGPHNCIDFTFVDHCTDWKEKSPHLTGIYGSNDPPRREFSTFLKTNSFSCLRTLICVEPIEDEEIAGALAINCPALQFLQIYYSDLYHWYADWHELLKRLFVLILRVPLMWTMPRPFPFRCFPKGCELRVLTMKGGNGLELLLGLEELLNIIDVCLPKLFLLNVIFYRYDDDSLSEIAERRGNLEYRFRQKSIDLRFAYRSEKGLVTLL